MVAVITGASDGIGKYTAIELYKQGYTVYGISKTPVWYSFMEHIVADVSDRNSLLYVLKTIYKKERRIDLFIACAGISLASPAELTKSADSRHLFDVNFWGAVTGANFALRRMKEERRGRIILISSITGLFPLPYLSYYSSSKAALISYAGALASEARPFGVSVSVVLPGGVRTLLTYKRKKYLWYQKDNRAPGLKKAIRTLGREEQTGLHPEQVAKRIAALATQSFPPVLCPVGGWYRFYMILQRILPSRWVLFMLRKKYSK